MRTLIVSLLSLMGEGAIKTDIITLCLVYSLIQSFYEGDSTIKLASIICLTTLGSIKAITNAKISGKDQSVPRGVTTASSSGTTDGDKNEKP